MRFSVAMHWANAGILRLRNAIHKNESRSCAQDDNLGNFAEVTNYLD